jgi:hypothetical protein
MSYTYSTLDIPRVVWDIMLKTLQEVNCAHTIDFDTNTIDMHGLALTIKNCDICKGSGRETINYGHGNVNNITCSVCTPKLLYV